MRVSLWIKYCCRGKKPTNFSINGIKVDVEENLSFDVFCSIINDNLVSHLSNSVVVSDVLSHYVYEIIANGIPVYVGETNDFERRKIEHVNGYSTNKMISEMFKLCDNDNHEIHFEVEEYDTKTLAKKEEVRRIEEYISLGYTLFNDKHNTSFTKKLICVDKPNVMDVLNNNKKIMISNRIKEIEKARIFYENGLLDMGYEVSQNSDGADRAFVNITKRTFLKVSVIDGLLYSYICPIKIDTKELINYLNGKPFSYILSREKCAEIFDCYGMSRINIDDVMRELEFIKNFSYDPYRI